MLYFYGIFVERTIVIVGCTYFSENFRKITNFYQKWRKSQVFGRKLKNHVSTQFENPVSPTNVIFGQIEPLGGFYNRYVGFFIFLPFSPILTPKYPKFCMFCHFFHFSGPKMGQNDKIWKIPA